MKRIEFGITDAMLEDVDEPIRKAAQATRDEIERQRNSRPVPYYPDPELVRKAVEGFRRSYSIDGLERRNKPTKVIDTEGLKF